MKKETVFTIECSMDERWVPYFCSMLKRMERNGKIGHSEVISFMSDGDGDFRPVFNFSMDSERVPPLESSEGIKVLFDAG